MAMPPPTLSISYTLFPPSSTSPPTGLSSTTTHEFPLEISLVSSESTSAETDSHRNNNSTAEEHYAALREALSNARETLGYELTQWRDAVGDGEKEKDGRGGEDKNGGDEDQVDEEVEEDVEEE
ncbi:hypothetical protein BU17DRAFT_93244 [Hysterangium stoloniferum]|nr:hypothetical protein BU17DRAFT_93244 [Hysterangium stoloniferum]